MQVSGVHPRRHRGHPAQRVRQARAEEIGGEQGSGERQQAREDEGARDASLRVRDRRQRLAHPNRHAQPAGHAHQALEQPQIAHVGERQRRIALG
jgi:hypothetical protein